MTFNCQEEIRNSGDTVQYTHQSVRWHDDNTIIKQTEQLSMELDEKNDTLCKFVVSNQDNHQIFQKVLMVIF